MFLYFNVFLNLSIVFFNFCYSPWLIFTFTLSSFLFWSFTDLLLLSRCHIFLRFYFQVVIFNSYRVINIFQYRQYQFLQIHFSFLFEVGFLFLLLIYQLKFRSVKSRLYELAFSSLREKEITFTPSLNSNFCKHRGCCLFLSV